LVEQVAVNHLVAGSSPARGANLKGLHQPCWPFFFGSVKSNELRPVSFFLHTPKSMKILADKTGQNQLHPLNTTAFHFIASEQFAQEISLNGPSSFFNGY
jgi:hypothetical protein